MLRLCILHFFLHADGYIPPIGQVWLTDEQLLDHGTCEYCDSPFDQGSSGYVSSLPRPGYDT